MQAGAKKLEKDNRRKTGEQDWDIVHDQKSTAKSHVQV